jgi:hypothetical protein
MTHPKRPKHPKQLAKSIIDIECLSQRNASLIREFRCFPGEEGLPTGNQTEETRHVQESSRAPQEGSRTRHTRCSTPHRSWQTPRFRAPREGRPPCTHRARARLPRSISRRRGSSGAYRGARQEVTLLERGGLSWRPLSFQVGSPSSPAAPQIKLNLAATSSSLHVRESQP